MAGRKKDKGTEYTPRKNTEEVVTLGKKETAIILRDDGTVEMIFHHEKNDALASDRNIITALLVHVLQDRKLFLTAQKSFLKCVKAMT